MGALILRIGRDQLLVIFPLLVGVGVRSGLKTENHQPLAFRRLIGQFDRFIQMGEKFLGCRRVERQSVVAQSKLWILFHRALEDLTRIMRPEVLSQSPPFQILLPGLGSSSCHRDLDRPCCRTILRRYRRDGCDHGCQCEETDTHGRRPTLRHGTLLGYGGAYKALLRAPGKRFRARVASRGCPISSPHARRWRCPSPFTSSLLSSALVCRCSWSSPNDDGRRPAILSISIWLSGGPKA